MMIVTGTKRSGTSMWMQILRAAGIPPFGSKFPESWRETLADANPQGFYESLFRHGIYYRTNPHPRTGRYLHPDDVRDRAVKVFIPGLCRTDRSFIDKVVATVRDWREYAASLERLRTIERAEREERTDEEVAETSVPMMDPVLEWWLENFALVRDLVVRDYPCHLVSYDRVVDDPASVVPEILEWLGAEEPEAGAEAVSAEMRTQTDEELEGTHEFEEVFDALFRRVHEGEALTTEFLERLNETHRALVPAIESEQQRVMEARRPAGEREADPLAPDVMEPQHAARRTIRM